jgi:flagellar biosynthesis protein FlhF
MNAPENSNMNIRRFVAETSRAALRQVRDTLGGDAIILANRSIEGGVEVLAAAPEAVDALTRRMTAPAAAPVIPTPTELGIKEAETAKPVARKGLASLFGRKVQPTEEPIAPTLATPAASRAASSYLTFADELVAAARDEDVDVVTHLASSPARRPAPAAPVVPAQAMEVARVAPSVPVVAVSAPVIAPVEAKPVVDAAALSEAVAREVKNEISREFGRDVINDLTHDVSREVSLAVSDEVTREVTREVTSSVTRDVTDRVTREIRAMHTTLSEQLATLTWTDAMRRQPGRTKLMQDLILAGFSPSLARHIQSRLPDDQPADRSTEWAKNILKRNLPIASETESLLEEGGVYALVGPTGVGKTTTVAKLAARFALKHGVEQLALITTDGFRIGAQDQLRIYGKILGIQVLAIHDEGSLAAAVEQLSKKKLVLIDTAGMSQRDERVAEQIAMLRGAKAKRLVVLNATCDAETLEHVVATYADREFAGCVITKTDEAVRLGPALDVVVRNRLRIHHVSTGQKVPEDLERPDADALVDTALSRVASRPAFELKTDDEPVWLSAMAGRADALDPALIKVAGVALEVAHV